MKHEISTAILAAGFIFLAGFYAGVYAGVRTAPSYHDALVIEKRLREVFCEQAVKNGTLKACDPTFEVK